MADPLTRCKKLFVSLRRADRRKLYSTFKPLAYIDSSGVGDLVVSVTTLRGQGGDLKIVNPSVAVQKLLQMTGLDILDVKPDEASALEAFSETYARGRVAHAPTTHNPTSACVSGTWLSVPS